MRFFASKGVNDWLRSLLARSERSSKSLKQNKQLLWIYDEPYSSKMAVKDIYVRAQVKSLYFKRHFISYWKQNYDIFEFSFLKKSFHSNKAREPLRCKGVTECERKIHLIPIWNRFISHFKYSYCILTTSKVFEIKLWVIWNSY